MQLSKWDCFPVVNLQESNLHSREGKVGYGRCTEDTVVGVIAKEYFGKAPGESTFDPVFCVRSYAQWGRNRL